MSYLVDTNLLLRLAEPKHATYSSVLAALDMLRNNGEILHVVPQNLIEFWAVATRPPISNGLGMTIEEAANELTKLKSLFELLLDRAAIFSEWEKLVTQHQVRGKQAHDARIVAAMKVHGVTQLLTFNTDDFKRYADITAVHPSNVAAP
ncbi:MAG: type II toxin-antitoxin system VapC family toxin [Blastocatellia bacterium]